MLGYSSGRADQTMRGATVQVKYSVLSPIPGRITLHRVGSGLVDLPAQILPSYDIALQSHSLGILRTLYIGMSVVTSTVLYVIYAKQVD